MTARLRFKLAFEKKIPDQGIKRAINDLAAKLGYHERTVEGWYYGEHEPNITQLDDLRTLFGDGFLDEVYPRGDGDGT